jgi:ABC-2 type transport system permease protein
MMHDKTALAAASPSSDATFLDLVALEWGQLRRDTIFWIACGLSFLSLWYGLANGSAWMRFQEQAIVEARAIGVQRLAEAKSEVQRRAASPQREIGIFDDPRSAVGFESSYLRIHDCLEPSPLAMVAVGQSDLLPYCYRVQTGPLAFFTANNEWENPLRLLLGRFDSAFAIITILPFLVLLVSFDLLAREAELGTLPLLGSCPVPISVWLATRFLLRAFTFVGLVLGAILLGVSALGFDAFAPGALLRLALYLAMTTAYLAFWFALAWFVNARGGSSASHALSLAAAWLVLVVLVPGSLNLAVQQADPLPSRVSFIDAIRRASDESARTAGELLKDFFHDHPELAPGLTRRADVGSRRLAVNQATEAAMRPEQEDFRRRNQSQQTLVDSLRFLSPAIVFQQAANALSGNDPSRHRDFEQAVEAHRAELRRFFAPHFVSDAPFTQFDDVPAFVHSDPPLGPAAKSVPFDILALLVPIALFVAGGAAALRRPLFERRAQ